MSLVLQQTAIDPLNEADPRNKAAIQAMLRDTQGNILSSHGRDHGRHLFVEFTGNAQHIGSWLATMATQHVTSAWTQYKDAAAHSATGADGGAFVNLCLSSTGFAKLGAGVTIPDDPSFARGAKGATNRLNDAPADQWEEGFQQRLDALVIVADDDAAGLEGAVTAIRASLDGIGTVVHVESGAAMRLDDAGNVSNEPGARVHEHFGFADGVSQPLFFAKDIEASRLNNGGFDRWDPSAPLGLALIKDPNGGPNGHGAYLVYRKLEQDVHGFHAREAALAETLFGSTPTDTQKELASAYVVGRFRDGTPVGEQAVSGWTNEPNNFNYDDDVDGVKCPFQAHARKTNPRGDKERQFSVPLGQERTRRIARRAISFGPLTLTPEPTDKVGLLFLCVQSSIHLQFEFMQGIWSNFDEFLRPGTGVDAVIGQEKSGAQPVPQKWPKVYGSSNELAPPPDPSTSPPITDFDFGQWVTMRGGEYFFMPSLSFLSGAAG